MKRWSLVITAACGMLGVAPALAQTPRTARTPIEHFVVLMQQDHSFDSYFGTYPGVDGVPAETCMPVAPGRGAECVRPFHMGSQPPEDLPAGHATFQAQYREGRMDGFVEATRAPGRDANTTMGFYDDWDIPYYWNVADDYVLFDRFFQSTTGGAVSNHLYWVAATADGNDSIPAQGFRADLPTIFDRLAQAGVSWKLYIQDYDPAVTYRTLAAAPPNQRAQVAWAPLLAFDRFLDDPALRSRIVDLSEYYDDLDRGTLPAVAYIVPAGSSELAPGRITAGEDMVRNVVNNLARSRYWSSSAFMWTYDGWGGSFDHVPPPQVDEAGYGFRVPALLVSPFARRGAVDHTELDFTSILRFIEDNWGLQPLATRDARANGLKQAFDFSAPARPPEFLSRERTRARGSNSGVPSIVLAYGVAIAASVATVGLAWRPWRSW